MIPLIAMTNRDDIEFGELWQGAAACKGFEQ